VLPNSTDLEYFIETASVLNMSRSAERLGITQPSLSLAVQRLEHAVGQKLFIRSKRGLELTPPGKILLHQSNELMNYWHAITAKSSDSVNAVEGRFTIGCHNSVALYSLNLFLPKLMQAYPDLEIKLKHDLSRKLTDAVIASEIDVAIVINPVHHPDLVITKLCTDSVRFWTSTSKSTSPNASSVLIFDPDVLQSQVLLSKANKLGIRFPRTIHSGSLEVVADLTAEGCGVGILPTRVAERASKKLVPYLNSLQFKDQLSLITRVESKKVRAVTTICSAIKAAFE
jgi:LysR family transcriptional regulator, cell division regulator